MIVNRPQKFNKLFFKFQRPLVPRAAKLALARRRAGAAIALLRQAEPASALTALRVDSGGGLRDNDPESRTQFIHRCRQRGVTAAELLECVDRTEAARQAETGPGRRIEDGVLYGLLLALGDFELSDLPAASREAFVATLARWYANDPSSAIHGASGWLLRQWKQELADKVDRTPAAYSPQREWFTLEFPVSDPATGKPPPATAPFYMTFVVFRAGDYTLGSPLDEPDRQSHEPRHAVTITRPFALADREVTWEQIRSFDQSIEFDRQAAWAKQFGRTLSDAEPAFGVNWYEAVRYCRWLSEQARLAESDQCYADPESLAKDGEGNPKDWPVDLEGRGFRLPTEAEWEVAARGGMNTAY